LLAAIAPVLICMEKIPVESFWRRSASASVIPVCVATLFYVGWSLRVAWRGRADFSRVLGVAIVGVAASLMMARMILNARYSHYGFVMMPLASLFGIHLMVVEAARPGAGSRRAN
jgi:hypothetical protein